MKFQSQTIRILHFSANFWWIFFRISRQIPESSDVCRFFNQICENKSEICRKFWILWKKFTNIQNYSLHSLLLRCASWTGSRRGLPPGTWRYRASSPSRCAAICIIYLRSYYQMWRSNELLSKIRFSCILKSWHWVMRSWQFLFSAQGNTRQHPGQPAVQAAACAALRKA